MEQQNITCCKCGKFILTESKEKSTGNIKCVKGSYKEGVYSVAEDKFYCKECANKIRFKKGERVFHKNLKLFGTFAGYAWESDDEADVDFEMEDGHVEQRHVSINQLENAEV